eukprot:gnl/Spiro4/12539_TR6633_c0_g1_i1.p1 gnl/Spiro4/12539_TR6633_c0_g1~~gnl/Spiro4/12539_TR6633_c0_g1_i1.p1  ORF type:complete len:791 (+),score=215.85 gnl/Spiro4/12539_TR6633_c0_g1_i1:39-2411(+)
MRPVWLVLLVVAVGIGVVACEPVAATRALIARVAGNAAADAFDIQLLAANSSEPYGAFEVASDNGRVVLRGTDAVALSSAFNYYLNKVAFLSTSWTGDNIALALPLPPVPPEKAVHRGRRVQWGYYQNVCTVSYSMAWWNWTRWERELDWMAMRGINMPLAFTGQEAIWMRVYSAAPFNLSLADLDQFFSGPAFLAWFRMGNMQKWGGPLPMSWIEDQLSLQIQILRRMNELGMTPVLPAFAGHVPEALTRIFPNANITRSPNWWQGPDEYSRDWFMEPTEPLYSTIGAAFIKTQSDVLSAAAVFPPAPRVYNADQFNEMRPASAAADYLSACGVSQMKAITDADPSGLWLMQGWLFLNEGDFWTQANIDAYLSAVPAKQMIVLDLFSDIKPVWNITNSFSGRPFIWNTLHNFGGNLGLTGNIENVLTAPLETLAKEPLMIGVGITMEGINQNAVVYDATLSTLWEEPAVPAPTQRWVDDYVRARYGISDADDHKTRPALDAWAILLNTTYNCTDFSLWGVTKSILELRPSLNPKDLIRGGFMPTELFYDPSLLVEAWDNLLAAEPALASVESFHYDFVDVTRQVLSNYHQTLYSQFVEAVQAGDAVAAARVGDQMSDLVVQLDRVLSSDVHFSLDQWIADARAWANDSSTADMYEWNARNQVTLWGPNGEIRDYASKLWSGLTGQFYAVRWQMFVTAVLQSLQPSAPPFNQTAFNADLLIFEQSWQHKKQQPLTKPAEVSGNSVVADCHSKYRAAVGSAAALALPRRHHNHPTTPQRRAAVRRVDTWTS